MVNRGAAEASRGMHCRRAAAAATEQRELRNLLRFAAAQTGPTDRQTAQGRPRPHPPARPLGVNFGIDITAAR